MIERKRKKPEDYLLVLLENWVKSSGTMEFPQADEELFEFAKEITQRCNCCGDHVGRGGIDGLCQDCETERRKIETEADGFITGFEHRHRTTVPKYDHAA